MTTTTTNNNDVKDPTSSSVATSCSTAVNPLGSFDCGCAGYSYNEWVGNFYPRKIVGSDSDRQFNHYQQHFSTVEINGTFYAHPSDAMIHKWKRLASPKFKLVLKANKTITHDTTTAGLNVAELRIFLNRALPLSKILAMILIQCPASKTIQLKDLQSVQALLNEPEFQDHRIALAFEFRNPITMEDGQLQAFLRAQDWTTVYHPNTTGRFTKSQIQEQVGNGQHLRSDYRLQPLVKLAETVPPSSNTVYVRLHGGRDDHAYDYSDEDLVEIAAQIHTWRQQGKSVLCFFLNCLPPQPWSPQVPKDIAHWAVMPKNATMLKRKVHGLAKEAVPLAPKQPRSTIASLFQKAKSTPHSPPSDKELIPQVAVSTSSSSASLVSKRKSPWSSNRPGLSKKASPLQKFLVPKSDITTFAPQSSSPASKRAIKPAKTKNKGSPSIVDFFKAPPST